MPDIFGKIVSYTFKEWHQQEGAHFCTGDKLFSIIWSDEVTTIYADKPGQIKKYIRKSSGLIRTDERLAFVDWECKKNSATDLPINAREHMSVSTTSHASNPAITTASFLCNGSPTTKSGSPPQFQASSQDSQRLCAFRFNRD